jgi:DNA-binding NtrC family response regulator
VSDINVPGKPAGGSPTPSILVVDDEQDILGILAFELRQEGYDVTAVDNGAAAVEAARGQRFSAAVTDLRMPGMDGLATMKALKQIDPDLPVIVATGFASEVASVAFGQQGAFGLILKPFGIDDFLDLVRSAVDERENNVQGEKKPRIVGRRAPGNSGIRPR